MSPNRLSNDPKNRIQNGLARVLRILVPFEQTGARNTIKVDYCSAYIEIYVLRVLFTARASQNYFYRNRLLTLGKPRTREICVKRRNTSGVIYRRRVRFAPFGKSAFQIDLA